MSHQAIGFVSGLLVLASGIPCCMRISRGLMSNPATWLLWMATNLVVVVTYRDAGAGASIWPAVFGFVNTVAAGLCMFVHPRARGQEPLRTSEFVSFIFVIASLVAWGFVRENKELVQYVLYAAIFADACGAVPITLFLWKNPGKDWPFSYILFAAGYALSAFAVKGADTRDFVLLLYMVCISIAAIVPLAACRLGRPWREWI